MRVALVGPVYPYRGGIAHYTAMLAGALAKRHETLVISFGRQYPGWLYPGKSDRDPSLEPLRTEAEFLLDPFLPWTWWQTAGRIREFGADLVVLQWWTTFWALAFGALAWLLRRQGERLTFVIHNVLPHENRGWDRWTARAVLGQATALVVQSAREEERLRAILPGVTPVVAYMPPFDGLAGKRVPRAAARRRLGIADEARVALFFGVVRPYKGLEHLIDAVAMLRDQGTPVQLIVAGQIWEGRAAYAEHIGRLRLADLVRLDDRYIPDEELPVLFGAADLFVAPYVDGTQSAALKTAIAYGLPIVATECVAADLGDAGDRVQLVPTGDTAALARGIGSVLRRQGSASELPIKGANPTWDALVVALVGTAQRPGQG